MLSLTASQFFRQALRVSFKKMDKNHSGTIDPDELSGALAHLYLYVWPVGKKLKDQALPRNGKGERRERCIVETLKY